MSQLGKVYKKLIWLLLPTRRMNTTVVKGIEFLCTLKKKNNFATFSGRFKIKPIKNASKEVAHNVSIQNLQTKVCDIINKKIELYIEQPPFETCAR